MGDLAYELNRLAGTTGRETAGAANVWAGTTGLELVGALNAKAGTTGLEFDAACRAASVATGASLVGTESGVEALRAALTIPAGLTGAALWWDASEYSGSGNWVDRNASVEATPVNAPTWSTVEFDYDGSNQAHSIAVPSWVESATDFTFMVAFRSASTPGSTRRLLAFSNGFASPLCSIHLDAAGSVTARMHDGTNNNSIAIFSSGVHDDAVHVAVSRYTHSTTTLDVMVDASSSVKTDAGVTFAPWPTFTDGRFASLGVVAYFAGHIRHVVLEDSAMSNADIDAAANYMRGL